MDFKKIIQYWYIIILICFIKLEFFFNVKILALMDY